MLKGRNKFCHAQLIGCALCKYSCSGRPKVISFSFQILVFECFYVVLTFNAEHMLKGRNKLRRCQFMGSDHRMRILQLERHGSFDRYKVIILACNQILVFECFCMFLTINVEHMLKGCSLGSNKNTTAR